jgi:hypothetical protein
MMTQNKNELFFKQDYLIIEDFYSNEYLKKIKPYLDSLDYELFTPPYMQECHMFRLMNEKIMAKVFFILINQKFRDLLSEIFNKEVELKSVRLTKYTAKNNDKLDYHSDFDNIRIGGFSIDLTFSDNCDSNLELYNQKTKEKFVSNKAGTLGRITFFRIDEHLQHRVTPTTQDDRFALTGWIKYKDA